MAVPWLGLWFWFFTEKAYTIRVFAKKAAFARAGQSSSAIIREARHHKT
jgi:hypothetical protein